MERALYNFPGAVIVASHDRFFIDKIATQLLVFEGQGRVRQLNANWTIWQAMEAKIPRDDNEHLR
jgi:ATP-binding cassette subfamily F protein uup